MEVQSHNNSLSIKGEILEILELEKSVRVKIICKPDWIILNLSDLEGLSLKDKLRIEGELDVKEVYKLEPDQNLNEQA